MKKDAIAGHFFIMHFNAIKIAVVIQHGAGATIIELMKLAGINKEKSILLQLVLFKIDNCLATRFYK